MLKREPNVIAFFDNDGYKIFLVISNLGECLAKNITLTITPDLDLVDEKIKDYFLKNAINQMGIHLAPNREYRILVGLTSKSSKLYKQNKIPTKYLITLDYENLTGKKLSQKLELTIDQFFNRLLPEYESVVEKYFKELNKNIGELISILSKRS